MKITSSQTVPSLASIAARSILTDPLASCGRPSLMRRWNRRQKSLLNLEPPSSVRLNQTREI